jgi:hypothetical protein
MKNKPRFGCDLVQLHGGIWPLSMLCIGLFLSCYAGGSYVLKCPCNMTCKQQVIAPEIMGPDSHAFALLVGLNNYNIPGADSVNLTYPEKAVRDMAQVLCKNGYNVATLTDTQVTRARIISEIRQILSYSKDANSNRFLFYFIGHAFPESTELALVTRYQTGIVFKDNTIYLSELYDSISASKTYQRIFLIDACQAGIAAPKNWELPHFSISILKNPAYCGITTWADKPAYERCFSKIMIDGLKGKAAANGKITVGSLAAYIDKGIEAYFNAGTGFKPVVYMEGKCDTLVLVIK